MMRGREEFARMKASLVDPGHPTLMFVKLKKLDHHEVFISYNCLEWHGTPVCK
jgi:hypothetical protein